VSSENLKNVLITGASSGIGFELAKLFAKENYRLILVSANKERLEVAGQKLNDDYEVHVKIIPQDLAKPNAIENILKELNEDHIKVDVLVNNAGIGTFGSFVETNKDLELTTIRVNVEALTHLTKVILPGMIERKSGKILNVASIAAFFPGPLMSVYYATKAYVLSFSEALNEELRGSGVTVTTLCPGPTITEFQKKAGIDMSGTGLLLTDVSFVAKKGYEGLIKGERVVVPGFWNQVVVNLVRFIPRSLLIHAVKSWHK